MRRSSPLHIARGGFTLVEMLVSVALVILMMSLFAEIFSTSTNLMTRQKGLAENDQRARLVMRLLETDLNCRTFRGDIVPFTPGMDTSLLPNISDLQGYFSISENDPGDNSDDVLRLTVDLNNYADGSTVKTTLPAFYGKATELNNLPSHPNQPEGDDGLIAATNNVGMSNLAEVVYFLRGGRLYRRQMLIREPYLNGKTGEKAQPMAADDATLMITGNYPVAGTSTFWGQFDYSAFFYGDQGHVHFHHTDSLSNRSTDAVFQLDSSSTTQYPISLGIPNLRFGGSTNSGLGTPPREYVGPSNSDFIGAFTHEETSYANGSPQGFLYPGYPNNTMSPNDPHVRTDLTLNATGTVDQYANGSRLGEELLLPNVLSFDVKVWDPGVSDGPDGAPGFAGAGIDEDFSGVGDDSNRERGFPFPPMTGMDTQWGALSDDGDWRDLGHSDQSGFFSGNQGVTPARLRNAVVPSTNFGNRFDTWHPFQGDDGMGNAVSLGLPPYRPMYFVPHTNLLDGTHQYWNRAYSSLIINEWTNTSTDTIVFPPAITAREQGYRWAFVRIGPQSAAEPNWTQATSYGTLAASTNTQWRAIPNWVPLRAIKIHIQYLDPSSGLIKDLTFVKGLVTQEQVQ